MRSRERARGKLLGLAYVASAEMVGIQPQRIFAEYDKARRVGWGVWHG